MLPVSHFQENFFFGRCVFLCGAGRRRKAEVIIKNLCHLEAIRKVWLDRNNIINFGI